MNTRRRHDICIYNTCVLLYFNYILIMYAAVGAVAAGLGSRRDDVDDYTAESKSET